MQRIIQNQENLLPQLETSQNFFVKTLREANWNANALANTKTPDQLAKDAGRHILINGEAFKTSLEYDPNDIDGSFEKFVLRALFKGNKELFKELFPSLKEQWGQPVWSVGASMITSALKKEGLPNETQFSLFPETLIQSVNLKLDSENRIYAEVYLTNLSLTIFPFDENNPIILLPGFTTTKMFLSRTGFIFDLKSFAPSNSLLSQLSLSEHTTILDRENFLSKKIIESIPEELKRLENDYANKSPLIKNVIEQLKAIPFQELKGLAINDFLYSINILDLILRYPTFTNLKHAQEIIAKLSDAPIISPLKKEIKALMISLADAISENALSELKINVGTHKRVLKNNPIGEIGDRVLGLLTTRFNDKSLTDDDRITLAKAISDTATLITNPATAVSYSILETAPMELREGMLQLKKESALAFYKQSSDTFEKFIKNLRLNSQDNEEKQSFLTLKTSLVDIQKFLGEKIQLLASSEDPADTQNISELTKLFYIIYAFFASVSATQNFNFANLTDSFNPNAFAFSDTKNLNKEQVLYDLGKKLDTLTSLISSDFHYEGSLLILETMEKQGTLGKHPVLGRRDSQFSSAKIRRRINPQTSAAENKRKTISLASGPLIAHAFLTQDNSFFTEGKLFELSESINRLNRDQETHLDNATFAQELAESYFLKVKELTNASQHSPNNFAEILVDYIHQYYQSWEQNDQVNYESNFTSKVLTLSDHYRTISKGEDKLAIERAQKFLNAELTSKIQNSIKQEPFKSFGVKKLLDSLYQLKLITQDNPAVDITIFNKILLAVDQFMHGPQAKAIENFMSTIVENMIALEKANVDKGKIVACRDSLFEIGGKIAAQFQIPEFNSFAREPVKSAIDRLITTMSQANTIDDKTRQEILTVVIHFIASDKTSAIQQFDQEIHRLFQLIPNDPEADEVLNALTEIRLAKARDAFNSIPVEKIPSIETNNRSFRVIMSRNYDAFDRASVLDAAVRLDEDIINHPINSLVTFREYSETVDTFITSLNQQTQSVLKTLTKDKDLSKKLTRIFEEGSEVISVLDQYQFTKVIAELKKTATSLMGVEPFIAGTLISLYNEAIRITEQSDLSHDQLKNLSFFLLNIVVAVKEPVSYLDSANANANQNGIDYILTQPKFKKLNSYKVALIDNFVRNERDFIVAEKGLNDEINRNHGESNDLYATLKTTAKDVLTEARKIKASPTRETRVSLLTQSLNQMKELLLTPTNKTVQSKAIDIANEIGAKSWGRSLKAKIGIAVGVASLFTFVLIPLGVMLIQSGRKELEKQKGISLFSDKVREAAEESNKLGTKILEQEEATRIEKKEQEAEREKLKEEAYLKNHPNKYGKLLAQLSNGKEEEDVNKTHKLK